MTVPDGEDIHILFGKNQEQRYKTVFELQKKIQYTINYNDLESHHAVILVRNQEGLKNLYRWYQSPTSNIFIKSQEYQKYTDEIQKRADNRQCV